MVMNIIVAYKKGPFMPKALMYKTRFRLQKHA